MALALLCFRKDLSVFLRFNGIEAGGWGKLQVVSLPAPEEDLTASRTDRIGRDGQAMGADFLRSLTWNITLLVNTYSYDDGKAVVNAVRDAWWDPAIRLSSNPMALEYSKDGQQWFTMYGRPVKYAGPEEGTRLDQGVAHIELQFEQTDVVFYSSGQELATAVAAPGATGGLKISEYGLTAPLKPSRTGGVRREQLVNAGNLNSPAFIRFHGPGQAHEISVGSAWTFRLRGELAWDEYVEVDARRRSVEVKRTTDGTVRSGFHLVGDGSRLSTLTIPPGAHPLTFSVIDDSLQAKVEISWPHTFSSMEHSLKDEG